MRRNYDLTVLPVADRKQMLFLRRTGSPPPRPKQAFLVQGSGDPARDASWWMIDETQRHTLRRNRE